jgi:DNA helicase-2/ATP-dependent DNA helicase PcrA
MLETLNPSQQDAVQHIDGPLLILAGAGSGKTKTVTSRLAYLIDEVGIPPQNTLTLTFTNKAAREMRERALAMITNSHTGSPLLSTFHKFGLLFLKLHMQKLNRQPNFVIVDSDDKKRIIKQFDSDLPPSLIANEISHFKNSLIDPALSFAQAELKTDKEIASIYLRYENYLKENNLVDFDDLLKLPYEILKEDTVLAKATSVQYQYIMIDEYQDTNEIQLQLLQLLCSSHSNICVVGDDDQSIYGWRGANINNILDFEAHFNGVKTIKLEDNYRSTQNILERANALIAHNRNRLGKTLRSTKGKGEAVILYESDDEKQESEKIAKTISSLLGKGVKPQEIAILYRINALSRSLEEGLNRAGISYKLVGGLRFYDRAEIKDVISYFRLIQNPHDDFSIKRVINKPKRGIGKVSLEKLEQAATHLHQSIFAFIHESSPMDLGALIGKKNAGSVKEFTQTLIDLRTDDKLGSYDFIDLFEDTIGLKKYYSMLPDAFDKVANLEEFYGLYRDFIKTNPSDSLDDFLHEIALQSDQDQIQNDSIYIMSVHASKGLEFGHVIIIGLEEKFLPITGDGSDLEEERRLGYVAFTRAKDSLILSTVKSRFYKGRRDTLTKSRFLKESGVIEGSLTLESSTGYKKGDLVKHKIFGNGRVTGVSKAGRDFKLTINFSGNKREILASFVEKI